MELEIRRSGADTLDLLHKAGIESSCGTRLRKVRLGSALDTVSVLWITSPLRSTTPRASPLSMSTCATSTPVRMSTPACRAALAMAWVMPPMPPLTMPTVPGALHRLTLM